ncbi:hypothetical protein CCU68_05980 [Pseudomonas gingeri NCPPB 3146 = LMG 5327]|uniref:Uncharacterized protein n=2 Tax=Pseudomonas gingeri TaxID=117681 RepID=A0A7Y7XXJ5_9PSED|nr:MULTISPECIES: hypothetical protein [Pseudomonas]NVZ29067.1 hypothetical protein [Pseudomonas gingeri]NVZ63105.1 hypothetical protein [Pseudomonas gingeri]NVZ75175.1 hypothetical protein [Pseudomonas gingeri]NWA07132.1 hypothetical protein [Pseudomonas gingeri]NWC14175.1 hypothetical protein [Pseudomonas gingeri]
MTSTQFLCAVLLFSLAGCDQSTASKDVVPKSALSDQALSDPDSPWAQARKRNISFRAVGNEPGWSVEIGRGETPELHLQMNYGEQKTDIAKTEATPEGFFGNAADGTEIQVLIDRETCTDDMSGQEFEASVLLKVGDRDYRGCGVSLVD